MPFVTSKFDLKLTYVIMCWTQWSVNMPEPEEMADMLQIFSNAFSWEVSK